ncbi:MAG: GPW/gp25 family protein [Paracoccaceae bacterium]
MKQHPTYAMDYPYRFAADGMTARTDRADHIRDLIEQLLFTRQGERLGRPTLGCGLPDLLFGPLNDDIATAARMTIQVALQEFLSRQIEVKALDVYVDGSALLINLTYIILNTKEEARMNLRAEAEQGP